MDRKNCMDACTTSPAESNNNVVKHVFDCNSRTKIENSMRRLCEGSDQRMLKRNNQAKRDLSKNNAASRAPTRNYLSPRGQGLGDRNFDNSVAFKSAQVGPNKWIAWNFDLVDVDESDAEDDVGNLRLCKLLYSHLGS